MTSAKSFPINTQLPKQKTLSRKLESPVSPNLSAKKVKGKSNINQVRNNQLNLFQFQNKVNPNRKTTQKNSNFVEKLNQLGTQANLNSIPNYGTVEQLKINNNPFWLKALMSLNLISSCITFTLIIATLSLYGWSVYTQQSWGKAYRYLETLQRNERQLTATNEIIKNELALEAQNPETGLVNPDPNTTLFLKPSNDKLKAAESIPVDESNSLPNNSNSNIPLGY